MNDSGITKLKNSLQVKVGSIFLLLAIAFTVMGYMALQWVVLPAFEQLEREAAVGDLVRVKQLIESELKSLSGFATEYSVWDDTYTFLLSDSPGYIEENVTPETWRDVDFDLMLFLDKTGEMVWGKGFDSAGKEIADIDAVFSGSLLAGRRALFQHTLQSEASGVLNLPNGLMLVVAQPVLRTDGSGPAAGYFVIGRFVAQRLEAYVSRAGVDFTLAASSPDVLALDRYADSSVFLESTGDTIASSEVWRNILGVDTALLEVKSPRKITALGNDTQGIAVLFLGSVSLLFILLSWVLIRRLVINPITLLQAHMSEISRTGDLSLSLDLNRNDEVGALAHEFDAMTTELQMAHSELEEARDQALTSARMKSEFLASMSHEIRTPMNGVIGMTELLLKTDLSQGQLRLVDTVRTSANTLLAIINDILDFSKMNAGKMLIDEKVFGLGRLGKEVNAVVTEPAQRKGLEYIYLENQDLPRAIMGDDQRIRQVLVNLVGNAIKFTETGEVVLSVDCTKTWFEDCVEWGLIKFTVSDTGVGIDSSQKKNIFSFFSQADNSTTRSFGGTGLGLSISKQLVELMGGEIGFESVAGEGSEFWFTLPMRLERDVIDEAGEVDYGTDKLRGLRVMLVDDNATNRELLLSHMASWGAQAEAFCSGAGALQGLQRAADQGWHYDLLVVDYHMPKMNGLRLSEQVSNTACFGYPVIVILSSVAETFSSTFLLAQGVRSYLSKPVIRDELYAQICRALTPEQAQEDELPKLNGEQDDWVNLNADILVAEDNAVNQELITILLENCGCNVVLAENGERALAGLEAQSFDLVIMDCQMPVMDGFEATRIIRERNVQSKRGGRLPILALTANAMEGDRDRCIAAGMDNYIAKPFKNVDLTNELRSLLPKVNEPACLEREALDRIGSLQREGQPNVLHRLIDIYLETSPGLVTELENGMSSNDAKKIELNAHTLQSSSANLGANGFAGLCAQIEEKSRAACMEDVELLSNKLTKEFITVCEALTRVRQSEC